MPWRCYPILSIRRASTGDGGSELLFTIPDDVGGGEVDIDNLPPGGMFHSSMAPPFTSGRAFDDGIPSFVVCVPGKSLWQMHHPGTDGRSIWKITGEIPIVTAHPSIHYVGIYHGWLKDGIVSEDVDGRRFDDLGRPLR